MFCLFQEKKPIAPTRNSNVAMECAFPSNSPVMECLRVRTGLMKMISTAVCIVFLIENMQIDNLYGNRQACKVYVNKKIVLLFLY